MKIFKNKKSIFTILMIFFLINLFFLTNFPFVHSDEAWLAGQSRTIMKERTYNITEPFFDLYPRSPHAIRIIFNTIQILFIYIFGYQIFSVRLISLLLGTVSLYFMYKIAYLFTKSNNLSYLITILLAVDIQFIYSSHFARQEIVLIAIFLISFYYFLSKVVKENKYLNDMILGIIITTAIGIHPNSFIVFLPIFFIYLYHLIFTDQIKFLNLVIFLLTVGGGALIFIALSLYFDPNFINNYLEYGKSLGALNSFKTKFDQLDYFYKKLYYQVSGTYFTPNIKSQFYIFLITIIYSIYKVIFKKDNYNNILIITFLAVNLGYILIGRYNQTSIIFIFPTVYLLIINSVKNIKFNYMKVIITLLIILISINSLFIIYNNINFNYDYYLDEISKTINKDDVVLANLNSQFYFDYNKLFDYRNLAYLNENNLTFFEYINNNKIEYIIYPQEMDLIYQRRPKWNDLYGNLYPYYQDMNNFLINNCKRVDQFENSTYGMRIVRFMKKKKWKVKIYKVIEDNQ